MNENGYTIDHVLIPGQAFKMSVTAPDGKVIFTSYTGLLQRGYDIAEAIIRYHKQMATAEALGIDTDAMAEAMARGVAL